MTDEITIEIDQAALEAVPIFPLPGTVLLPHTLISLHVFEPRYRQMMAYCLERNRVMALAMLDERGRPDGHRRPPIHRVAGLGYVRRSARLPDGRYNIVLEGVARIDVSEEHPPEAAFRRARARLLEDVVSSDADAVRAATNALRALCSRAFTPQEGKDLLAGMNQLDPGHLADVVAAAVVEEASERQRILEAVDVLHRLELVSGALGARLFDPTGGGGDDEPEESPEPVGARWGIVPGKA